MTWFLVDDDMSTHHKIVRAGNAAVGLWARAGSWSSRYLTDGFIPDDILPTLGTKRQADKLVQVGLWHRDDERGGYEFHEWEPRQRHATRKAAEKRRQADAERQRRHRARERQVAAKVQPPHEKFPKNCSNPQPNFDTQENAEPQVNDTCHGVTHAPVTPPSQRDLTRAGSDTDTNTTNPPTTSTSPTERARDTGPAITGTNSATAYRLVDTTIGRNIPSTIRTALAIEAATLLPETGPDTIREALQRWNNRTGIGPRVLPSIAADIIKERSGAGTTLPAGARIDAQPGRSARGDKVRGWLALGAEIDAQSAAESPFLVIDGGRSA